MDARAAEIHGLLAVGRFPDHLEVGCIVQHPSQRRAEEGMILSYDDPRPRGVPPSVSKALNLNSEEFVELQRYGCNQFRQGETSLVFPNTGEFRRVHGSLIVAKVVGF